jgi:predicted Zn-dependent peptidase
MRELAYSVHPYRWMTIGKELSHIENAQLDDVKQFFFKHYRPVNAILVVAGNIKTDDIKRLADKWFGSVPMGEKYNRQLPREPVQSAPRKLEVTADVPFDAFYKTWHMPSRLEKGYYVAELITEILGGGGSSRLYQTLVKEKQLFSNIECYQFGSVDTGLITIEGKLIKGVKPGDAEKAIEEELSNLKAKAVSEAELQKVKNKTESAITFEDMSVMNRANSLAFYELLGNADLMNQEMTKYDEITMDDILLYSNQIFSATNSNTLYYFSKN